MLTNQKFVVMRLVTCVGSKFSGKTCLLNILQEQAHDGRCFSIQDQNEIFSVWEEFNHKPNKSYIQPNHEKDGDSKRKPFSLATIKNSNKITPSKSNSLENIKLHCKNNASSIISNSGLNPPVNTKTYQYSELLGKTAPTIGVDHFEFNVDDLTLQVAGKYRKRKESEKKKLCTSVGCCSAYVNDKSDVIELRELGGEIGK